MDDDNAVNDTDIDNNDIYIDDNNDIDIDDNDIEKTTIISRLEFSNGNLIFILKRQLKLKFLS